MTWKTRTECPRCDEGARWREIRFEKAAVAVNGVTVQEVRCADCDGVIGEELGYDSRADCVGHEAFSWIGSDDVVTRDDV